MHPWTEAQLAAFLDWAAEHSQNYPLWHLLAMTGMRRGEALALRWRDVDLDAGTVSVRRSAGIVRYAGEGAEIVEGDTKSGKPRVVDLDADTVAVLRARKRERGAMALQLGRADALVFGTIEGEHRNPRARLPPVQARRGALPEQPRHEAVPGIRLHDLRHTHATIMLLDGRARARGQPAARPRLADGHADHLRPRDARQPARRR